MARALAAATVAALLALPCAGAGFRAAGAATRWGGRVRGGLGAAVPHGHQVDTCAGFTAFWIWDEVLPGAFVLAPDFTFKEQLVSHVEYTRTPPFTLTYHIRPEARWSDGVPVSAADFVFTHQAIRRLLPPDSPNLHFQVRAIRALGEEDRAGGPALTIGGVAAALRPRAAPARTRRRGPPQGLEERDRQSQDGQADRQRPLPRQVGAGQAADSPPQPPLLGAACRPPRPHCPSLLPGL